MGDKAIVELVSQLELPGNLKTGINMFGDKGRVTMTGFKQNGCYMSKDIDFDTDPFGLRAQIRPVADVTTSTLATFNDTPKWMVKANSGKYYTLSSTNEIFLNNAGYTRDHVSGSAGTGQGMVEYNDDFYWVQTSVIGKMTGGVYTDSWNSRSATNSTYGPAIKFIGKAMFGSGRYIDAFDGTTFQAAVLTLPLGEVIRSFEVWNDFLVIGCSSGNMYGWDGTSTVYNWVQRVPNEAGIDILKNVQNTLHVVCGRNAAIYQYDGANFNLKAFIPDILQTDFDGATVALWSGAACVWKDKLAFCVQIQSAINSIRTKSGIWTYTPSVDRLTLEFSASNGQVGTQYTVGCLYYDSVSDKLFHGFVDSNAGADGSYIDLVSLSSVDSKEGHYIISNQILPAEFALAFLRQFYINCSLLPTSSSKIMFALRLNDEEEIVIGKSVGITAGAGSDFNNFYTGSNVALVHEGDMIEIISGPGAGEIRFIDSIDNSVTPKQLHVSEQFSTEPVSGQSIAIVYRYNYIGEINGDDALTMKGIEVGLEAQKVWVLIAIRGFGNSATGSTRASFKKGTMVYVQRPNA